MATGTSWGPVASAIHFLSEKEVRLYPVWPLPAIGNSAVKAACSQADPRPGGRPAKARTKGALPTLIAGGTHHAEHRNLIARRRRPGVPGGREVGVEGCGRAGHVQGRVDVEEGPRLVLAPRRRGGRERGSRAEGIQERGALREERHRERA